MRKPAVGAAGFSNTPTAGLAGPPIHTKINRIVYISKKPVAQAKITNAAEFGLDKLVPSDALPKGPGLNSIIIGDVIRLIARRRMKGTWKPENAREAFEVVLPRLVRRGYDRGALPSEIAWRVSAWAQKHVPELFEQMGPSWFHGRALAPLAPKSFGSVDRESRRLMVLPHEEPGLHWLRSIERPKAVRKREHLEKDAVGQRRRREAAGAKPHAKSAARRKPWEARGWSRAKWYRRLGEARAALVAARERRRLCRETVSSLSVTTLGFRRKIAPALERETDSSSSVYGCVGHRSEIASAPSTSPGQTGDGTEIGDTDHAMVPTPTREIGHDLKTALTLVGLGSDDPDAIWIRLKANAAAAAAEFADLDDGFLTIRTAEQTAYMMAA